MDEDGIRLATCFVGAWGFGTWQGSWGAGIWMVTVLLIAVSIERTFDVHVKGGEK